MMRINMQVRKRKYRYQKCFFPAHESIPRLVMIDGQDNQLVTER